eukprot:4406465-Pleurochrysis_carterae.AAC.1
MAIPEKRQAGTSVLWLRIIFVAAAGMLFLSRDKALRAVDRILNSAPSRGPLTRPHCANFVASSSTCVESG